MIDLTLAVQAAEAVALGIMVPAAGMLARRGLTSVEKWLHLRLTQQQEACTAARRIARSACCGSSWRLVRCRCTPST